MFKNQKFTFYLGLLIEIPKVQNRSYLMHPSHQLRQTASKNLGHRPRWYGDGMCANEGPWTNINTAFWDFLWVFWDPLSPCHILFIQLTNIPPPFSYAYELAGDVFSTWNQRNSSPSGDKNWLDSRGCPPLPYANHTFVLDPPPLV